MEQMAFIPEFVQYGVIGICVLLIIANVVIVKTCINVILKFIDEIKSLNATINELKTSVELLTIRTKTMRRAFQQQSGIINGERTVSF
jgi:F0F1-type ATP synthase membrane subunit b/b'